jgi:hypothetical protein
MAACRNDMAAIASLWHGGLRQGGLSLRFGKGAYRQGRKNDDCGCTLTLPRGLPAVAK